MGFGIEITGEDGGGVFNVQDTDLNMINYQITSIGAGSSVAVPGGKSRVFINGNYSGVYWRVYFKTDIIWNTLFL